MSQKLCCVLNGTETCHECRGPACPGCLSSLLPQGHLGKCSQAIFKRIRKDLELRAQKDKERREGQKLLVRLGLNKR